jgi:hypothetical protein
MLLVSKHILEFNFVVWSWSPLNQLDQSLIDLALWKNRANGYGVRRAHIAAMGNDHSILATHRGAPWFKVEESLNDISLI